MTAALISGLVWPAMKSAWPTQVRYSDAFLCIEIFAASVVGISSFDGLNLAGRGVVASLKSRVPNACSTSLSM